MSGLTGPRWVVHIPFAADNEEHAIAMGNVAASFLHESMASVDARSGEVSREDNQSVRWPLFCNKRLPDGQHCDLHPGHTLSPCSVEVLVQVAYRP